MKMLEAVQRWEELGQQLEEMMATYLDACRILESLASDNPASAHSLVSQIEHRLDIFPTSLSQPLVSAHSSVVRTRNSIVSPAHRMPHEILSKIFHLAIYSIDIKDTSQLKSEYRIRTIYRRLHALAGVCSLWRRVGLEESFWSLVPIIEQPSGRYMTTAAQLSLERVPNHRLSLAANLKGGRPDMRNFVVTMLSQQGHRFESINLHTTSSTPTDLIRSMEVLMECTSDKKPSLKVLSLYCTPIASQQTRRAPDPTAKLFSTDSPMRSEFESLIQSLSILHLSGLMVPLDIEDVLLRNLTQLTLQRIILQNNLEFASSLRALTSSSHLRTLKIISVSVLFWTTEEDFLRGFPIVLPALQHLYMEDLITSLLELTLRAISPGSHRVAINWTDKTSSSIDSHGPPRFPTEMNLSDFKVDALFMSGRQNTRHPFTNVIRPTMETLSTVTELYLDSLVVDSETLDCLTPASVNGEEPSTNPQGFPKLKSIQISRSHCHDLKVLHNLPQLLANYPLEELGIGIGPECSCFPDPSIQADFDSEMGLVWKSLANVAPKLRRLPTKTSEFSNAAFESDVWQLSGHD